MGRKNDESTIRIETEVIHVPDAGKVWIYHLAKLLLQEKEPPKPREVKEKND